MNGERPHDRSVDTDALLDKAVAVFTAGGWQVHLVREAEEAIELITELASAAPGGTVLHKASLPNGLPLAEELNARGLSVASFGAEVPEDAARASAAVPTGDAALPAAAVPARDARKDPSTARSVLCSAGLGVTGAGVLVAETGTLLLAENDGYGRLVSNLPPAHVAVAFRSQLVATLGEGLAAVREAAQRAGAFPRYLSGISGPSKTGDIDMEIVRGMHGPGEVHLIVIV